MKIQRVGAYTAPPPCYLVQTRTGLWALWQWVREMLVRFRELRTVDHLDKELQLRNFNQRIIEVRSRFNIVVIDDKEFTPLPNLLRHNYKITHMPDVPAIDAVARYQIVLCDLVGVGMSLSPTMQGVHLLAEIKKNYPEKVVVAYTGAGDHDLTERSITIADYYLKKDINIEEWCETLDRAILDLANPATVWRKLRPELLDAHVSPFQLAVLEDTFVRNVLLGRDVLQPAMLESADKQRISSDARAIIQSVVGSALFELIKALVPH